MPGGTIAFRNSRDTSGPALIYPRTEVAAFLHGLKNGEFDTLIALSPAPGAPGAGHYSGPDGPTTPRPRGDIVQCAPHRLTGPSGFPLGAAAPC